MVVVVLLVVVVWGVVVVVCVAGIGLMVGLLFLLDVCMLFVRVLGGFEEDCVVDIEVSKGSVHVLAVVWEGEVVVFVCFWLVCEVVVGEEVEWCACC